MNTSGPLAGFRIVELAGIGPNPFCAMLLADLGADIIRVDRLTNAGLGVPVERQFSLLNRSRRSIAVDLKTPEGVDIVLRLVEQADALIEGFRPGVTERMGLGPDDCLARNPKLVYGRITGWGQHGPLSQAAGHDINYVSLAGAAHAIGRRDSGPVPPLNLVGDFGGGGMLLAVGVLAALLEAHKSGKGQVVDAAMTDGVATLMTGVYGLLAAGVMKDQRESNILDGGSHFYDIYETADGKYISIASLEPKFYKIMLELTGFDDPDAAGHMDRERWPELSEKMGALFKTRTRDAWCEILEGTDVCFAPVLSMEEAPNHPHNRARKTFVEKGGVTQPAPSPRFSRTPGGIQCAPSNPGADTAAALADWGFAADEISMLREQQVIATR